MGVEKLIRAQSTPTPAGELANAQIAITPTPLELGILLDRDGPEA